MAGATFTVTIQDDAVAAGLRRLAAAGGDLTALMDELGAMLVTATQVRFERGEAPDGTAWPASGRARRDGGQTLVDSGRLRDSVTHAPGPDRVQVGTNVVYAAIHQFGGTVRPRNKRRLVFPGLDGGTVFAREVTLPARPFLGISDADAREIEAIVGDFLAETFGGTA